MIFVECKADKVFLKTIGIEEKIIYHAGGKGRVVHKLIKCKKEIGIIDEDPGRPQPKKLKQFKLIKEVHNMKILQDENENKLILLNPRLEEWILNITKRYNLKIEKFNLPHNGEEFHKIINSNTQKFENLLENIKKKKLDEIEFLKNYILKI